MAIGIGIAEKVGKIISKGDSIKDVTYALSHLSKTYATARRVKKAGQIVDAVADGAGKVVNAGRAIKGAVPKEEGGLLDMLTISYWAKKAFSGLDRPPAQVEDLEYKTQYKQGGTAPAHRNAGQPDEDLPEKARRTAFQEQSRSDGSRAES